MRGAVLVAIAASIGNMLQGWDNATIAGAVLYIKREFDLESQPTIEGLIVAMSLIGATVITTFSGPVSDSVGRRPMLVASSVLYFLSGLIMLWSPNVHVLLLARLIDGFGIGLAVTLVPVYISETAPPEIRGLLNTLPQFTGSGGMFLSYCMIFGMTLAPQPNWRAMLGVLFLPSVLYLALTVHYLPESPRWLVSKGRMKEARDALQMLRGREDVSGLYVSSRRNGSPGRRARDRRGDGDRGVHRRPGGHRGGRRRRAEARPWQGQGHVVRPGGGPVLARPARRRAERPQQRPRQCGGPWLAPRQHAGPAHGPGGRAPGQRPRQAPGCREHAVPEHREHAEHGRGGREARLGRGERAGGRVRGVGRRPGPRRRGGGAGRAAAVEGDHRDGREGQCRPRGHAGIQQPHGRRDGQHHGHRRRVATGVEVGRAGRPGRRDARRGQEDVHARGGPSRRRRAGRGVRPRRGARRPVGALHEGPHRPEPDRAGLRPPIGNRRPGAQMARAHGTRRPARTGLRNDDPNAPTVFRNQWGAVLHAPNSKPGRCRRPPREPRPELRLGVHPHQRPHHLPHAALHRRCHEAHGRRRPEEAAAGDDPGADRVAGGAGRRQRGADGGGAARGAVDGERRRLLLLLRHGLRPRPQHPLLRDLPHARARPLHRPLLPRLLARRRRRHLHPPRHAPLHRPRRRLRHLRRRLLRRPRLRRAPRARDQGPPPRGHHRVLQCRRQGIAQACSVMSS